MKIIAIVCAFLAFSAADVAAQMTQEEVGILQNLYGMEKRAIYKKVMELTPSDSVAFWPIYDAFEIERKDLGQRRVQLLQKFVSKYPAISAEELDEIIEGLIEIREELLDLETDAYEDLKEKTSTMTAAKFIQIESFLNTMISAELAVEMPFIGAFHEKK